MKIFNRFFISILTCFLFVVSVGAEEPLVEDAEAPLVYNTEENKDNIIDTGTDNDNVENVVDNSVDTDDVEVSTPENNPPAISEDISEPSEEIPTAELGEFKTEVTYNEEHTIASIVIEYLGDCTELSLNNEDDINPFVEAGLYQIDLEHGDWTNKIAFNILSNGMIYFDINVWNEDTLIVTKLVKCSVIGLNNDALIFDPNQEATTYTTVSSDVGVSDSQSIEISYATNVSYTWSIPTSLELSDIEGSLPISIINSDLAPETALRVRINTTNGFNLANAEVNDDLTYIVKDSDGNRVHDGDVILDHLYNQDSSSNTLNIDITKMPVYSGKYNDTWTFTASVERLLSDLYSGQTAIIKDLGRTHNLINMKIYGISKQNGTPSPDNPVEIQSTVNPTITVSGMNILKPTLETLTYNGVTCTQNIGEDGLPDGTYTLNGTSTGTDEWKFRLASNIPVTIGETYKINNNKHSPDFYYIKADINNEFSYAYSGTFTSEVEEEVFYLKFGNGATFNNEIVKPMVTTNLSATEDDFEPYVGEPQTATMPYTLNAIPVSSGGNVTINGQQYISDYVDIEQKKLVRMVGEDDLGTLYWYKDGVNFWYTPSVPRNLDSNTCISNKLLFGGKATTETTSRAYWYLSGAGYFELFDDAAMTQDDVKNNYGGTTIFYKLITPTEVDLTDAEVQAFKDLYTYSPTTVVSCSSEQLTPYIEFSLS